MKQAYDPTSLRIGPNKTYWWFFLVVAPAAVYGLIHVHEFRTFFGTTSVGGLLAFSLHYLVNGGLGMELSKDGIQQTWFGLRLRQIPWDQIKDVCCYPEHNSHYTEVKSVTILIRTYKCKGDPPRYYIGYHADHPIKTLWIDYGDYSPAFERFTTVTYIPPKEEWCKGDDFPD